MGTIIKIQRKGQVTIPTRLRVQVGLTDGDFVEAKAERGKIVLTPKLIVDREYTPAQRRVIDAHLAESLEQVKRGETYGPFRDSRRDDHVSPQRGQESPTQRKPHLLNPVPDEAPTDGRRC